VTIDPIHRSADLKRMSGIGAARIVALQFLFPALLLPHVAAAQTGHSSRPVRLVVPSAAGGGTDMLARVIAQSLSESLGQQIIVDNHAGAGQMIGLGIEGAGAVDDVGAGVTGWTVGDRVAP
jgi:hypothetical protein